MFDPATGLTVTSNTVAVSVLSAGSAIQAATQPPFMLAIRPAQIYDGKIPFDEIFLAITNTSDHPIDFDIGAGDYDIDVYDEHGVLAPLTENGRRGRGRLRTAASGGSPTIRLQPGETKSGGAFELKDYYHLIPHGRYTVQVRALDDESKTIVVSDKIVVEVDK
jgi:hypothetical protein